MSNLSDKKRIITKEANESKDALDKMEYRFAINEISKDIFERQSQKILDNIKQKVYELENLPTKKSNHEKAIKYFLKISENPSKFYTSLDYNKKRKFQEMLFPEGFNYSIKNRDYRTSKVNSLFTLTSSFKEGCSSKKQKTHYLKSSESSIVPRVGIEPTHFRTRV